MMRRGGPLALVLVCSASGASAASLQPDRVYGNEAGCAVVASNDFTSDAFIVVTTQYLRAHESSCEFVQVIDGRHDDLFVNAICSGEGETWPATYVITPLADDGTVSLIPAAGDPIGALKECRGLTADQADSIFGG